MPIDGVSDVRRLPRLGKIRLGEKVNPPGKNPYPKATDYFVVPEEVAEVFGPRPTELEIMFPLEDEMQFAQQWLRAYSFTQGLVCKGDGQTCRRKMDKKRGCLADHETEVWEWKDDLPCNPQECPDYVSKRCRRVMNLQFLLPDVPGLGVWQIDTSSFYGIVNVNNMVRMLKSALGRCSMIPLTLTLGPQEVQPLGQKKKTVHVINFKSLFKISDLIKHAVLPIGRGPIPEPDEERPPDDLFPDEVLEHGVEVEEEQSSQPMTELEFVAECKKRGYSTSVEVYEALKIRGGKKELLKKMTYDAALKALPASATCTSTPNLPTASSIERPPGMSNEEWESIAQAGPDQSKLAF